jgi:hypothetical protein
MGSVQAKGDLCTQMEANVEATMMKVRADIAVRPRTKASSAWCLEAMLRRACCCSPQVKVRQEVLQVKQWSACMEL